MKLPLEISFQGLPHSSAIEDAVRCHADKLDRHYPDITRCRVAIVVGGKHPHQGKPFGVRIDVTIPGRELVSNQESDEDLYVALRDAFDNTRRMLENATDKIRGDVKRHEPAPVEAR